MSLFADIKPVSTPFLQLWCNSLVAMVTVQSLQRMIWLLFLCSASVTRIIEYQYSVTLLNLRGS